MKFALSFLIGAVLGAALALLFAPSSGEELWANIKKQVDTQSAKLQDEWQKGTQEIQTRVDKMSDDLQTTASLPKKSGKSA
jgi:gas vesicle protein